MRAPRPLVLASASPRRRALMTALQAPAQTISPTADEQPRRPAETPEDFVVRLSAAKAREVSYLILSPSTVGGQNGGASRLIPSPSMGEGQDGGVSPAALVIGADTAVVVDGEVLGKPAHRAEAFEMLRRLRGRTHRVMTGVTVVDAVSRRAASTSRTTDVLMRRYADDEISAYVDTGSPFDKAGGYAVQDPVFAPAESVDGCYLNVVGLPLCDTLDLLAGMGADADLDPDWSPPDGCVECPLKVAEAVR